MIRLEVRVCLWPLAIRRMRQPQLHRPEQRLAAQEPHTRRDREQRRDARIGPLLIFDGRADPDVGGSAPKLPIHNPAKQTII